MAGRPYWSGQLKISLVSFGVQLFPASSSQSGVTFHQIDRATGERIHHLNVIDDSEPVESSEIVKGYEYSKGKYLIVEPDEIEKLRIDTKNVIDVKQFVARDELPPALYEKPYFVVPEPKESADAFAVVRRAMEQTGKVALGEIAFGGREHLVSIAVPYDPSQPGLMAYTLRYEEELRKSEEYFSDVSNLRTAEIDKKQLSMAVQLIEAYSHPLNLHDFKDDYEAALRKLIDAKQKNVPLPLEEKAGKPTKVVNLMDALRRSVNQAERPAARSRRAGKAVPKKGPVLVGGSRRKRKAA
ncbi:MAG: Ku protein [Terracidiphilus sp.]